MCTAYRCTGECRYSCTNCSSRHQVVMSTTYQPPASKKNRYRLNRMLGGPQGRSGRFAGAIQIMLSIGLYFRQISLTTSRSFALSPCLQLVVHKQVASDCETRNGTIYVTEPLDMWSHHSVCYIQTTELTGEIVTLFCLDIQKWYEYCHIKYYVSNKDGSFVIVNREYDTDRWRP